MQPKLRPLPRGLQRPFRSMRVIAEACAAFPVDMAAMKVRSSLFLSYATAGAARPARFALEREHSALAVPPTRAVAGLHPTPGVYLALDAIGLKDRVMVLREALRETLAELMHIGAIRFPMRSPR